MLHYEREIREPELIAAMLDMFDTVYVGFTGEKCPYVVPLNFGYDIKDSKLLIYVHCAKEGYKLGLLAKNPVVSVTFSKFSNFPDRPYKGHWHDYRSVMGYGVMAKIDRSIQAGKYGNAFQRLLTHNGRRPNHFDPEAVPLMDFYCIECELENVYGKSECPVRKVEDVPFADVYNLPIDDEPYDISDLLARPH